jgi:nitroreductase
MTERREGIPMTPMQAILERHSVRSYESKPIPGEIRQELEREIHEVNQESGLRIQVLWDAAKVFEGKIKGAENCIALIGKGPDLEERLGYYGARILLKIQMLGMNSVWVASSFHKRAAAELSIIEEGESLVNAIAFGYGTTQGNARKSKRMEKLCSVDGEMPDWFEQGMRAAMLAPTAINQQQFQIRLKDGRVSLKAKLGVYSRVDLGIVRYFFEQGSGRSIS